MNESEFRRRWGEEIPVYRAWGDYVVKTIKEKVAARNYDPDSFFKVFPSARVKDESSLVDKAFYRPEKSYRDPYQEIEDKVGARFVVLLVEEIAEIRSVIERAEEWRYELSRSFEDERDSRPELFAYQSVHYVLWPAGKVVTDDVEVPEGTPCEVQVRTLMQHAHAELTHDAIYKSKRTVDPWIHRTVARSMALIETTDECFSNVSMKINCGPLEEFGVVKQIDGVYRTHTGHEPRWEKSSVAIWDAFEDLVDETIGDRIQEFVKENAVVPESVKRRYTENNLYQQSVSLFICWMLKKKKSRLLRDWPLDRRLLGTFAADLGISLN